MDIIIVIIKYFYVSVAVGFLTATYLEGRHNGDVWDWQRLAGLLACLVWPILLFVMLTKLIIGKSRLS